MIATMNTSQLISTGASALPSKSISDAAQYIWNQTETCRNLLRSSLAFGLHGQTMFNELDEVFSECLEADWDGICSEAITESTYQNTKDFLNTLPLGISAPSIGAEPDGHLTLEWYKSPRCTLSVSISPEGDLHYAALIGASKAFGTEPFCGKTPQSIMSLIARIAPA